MKIVHHSNACFSLFHQDLHILFDPWIESHAVAGGWTQFPPVKIKTEELPRIDYIFISHIHSDHCEIETLKKIPQETPVIIIDREPNFLKTYLVKNGFRNLILCPLEKNVQICEKFSVELLGESFGHLCSNIIDSSIVFQFSDGKVVLNCNDNKLHPDLAHYIKNKYKEVDLAFIPCGGGSGYPAMYENISFEDKLKISSNIIDQYAKIFTEGVDAIKPKIVIPVAGGFAIRGEHAESVNWTQCRRFNLNEVSDYYYRNSKSETKLETKVIPMQPGLQLDCDQQRVTNGEYHVWTDSELRDFFKKLSVIKIEPQIELKKNIPNISKIVSLARQQLWLKQCKNNMKPDYKVYLDIEGADRLILLDLAIDSCTEVAREQNLVVPFLKMKLDQNTLMEWLMGYEDFNMLDSGHRISFWREPINKYVQEAYYLMSLLRLS